MEPHKSRQFFITVIIDKWTLSVSRFGRIPERIFGQVICHQLLDEVWNKQIVLSALFDCVLKCTTVFTICPNQAIKEMTKRRIQPPTLTSESTDRNDLDSIIALQKQEIKDRQIQCLDVI